MQPTTVMLFGSEVLVAEGCGRPAPSGRWMVLGAWVGAVGASGFAGGADCCAAADTASAKAMRDVQTMRRISYSLLLSRDMAAVNSRRTAVNDPADRL